MKEKLRKIKAFFYLLRFWAKLPAWAALCLADSVRRAGDSEYFHSEVARLQQKAYEIQKAKKDV
jgi:hypothetical protein